MAQLLAAEVLHKGTEVLLVRGDEDRNVEVSIFLRAEREVISLSENLNAVGNIADSAN